MTSSPLYSLVLLISFSFLYSQRPINDDCRTPLTLPINQWIEQSNHDATLNFNELPPAVPFSCINTFENDLWYQINTTNLKQPIRIILYPYQCNTPAGVQSILYSTYNCKELNKNILYCFTKDVGDTIQFIIPEPQLYENLMLYVDGFDGNICQFKIGVFILEEYHPFDFCKYMRFDYLDRLPNWKQPLLFNTQNNRIHIQWTHESPDILGYAVQIKMKNGYKTLSCFNAQNYTFANQNFMEYLFNPDQLDTQKVCFRLLAFYKNEIMTSSDYCTQPKVIKNFWVSNPKLIQPNEYLYIYKFNKSQKATIRLKNSQGEIVKSKVFKVSKGNFEDTISLQGLPKSNYIFEFCVDSDCFEYPLMEP